MAADRGVFKGQTSSVVSALQVVNSSFYFYF